MSTPGKRITIVHGGPRKGWNTATLLEHAAEGARSTGATVEWVDLYDLDFKGCKSCFACKVRGGRSYGRCVQRDGLASVLESLEGSDALLIGSPIYFGSVTGETRSFLERLLFPLFTYTDPPRSLFPRRIPVGLIYTMNLDEQRAGEAGDLDHLKRVENALSMILGSTERIVGFDTLQFEDYGKYVADRWDPVHKAKQRREVFPQDCAKARELGARLVQA